MLRILRLTCSSGNRVSEHVWWFVGQTTKALWKAGKLSNRQYLIFPSLQVRSVRRYGLESVSFAIISNSHDEYVTFK